MGTMQERDVSMQVQVQAQEESEDIRSTGIHQH